MILVLDTENTTWNNGNPFDQRNFNVCISFAHAGGTGVCYTQDEGATEEIRQRVAEATLIVGFNLKYDLHWLRKLGIDFAGKRVWCCQAAAYFLDRQQTMYPDLDSEVKRYGLGEKSTVVEEQYWRQGVNTHEIPRDILTEYAARDSELTYKLYLKQKELVQPHQSTLLSIVMQDLLVLQEMEWNGLCYDEAESLKQAQQFETEILNTQTELSLLHSVPCFNFASNDHLSALLYGGTIVEERRTPVGVYKTGEKAGQPRFKIERVEHQLPRMYAPIRGSENKKEGTWSVDESYLKKLKGRNKNLITGILKIKENQKLVSTYFRGIPELRQEMCWKDGIIHGQLNQCTTRTGRLSATKPNQQNLSKQAKAIFRSRYDH